MRKNVYLRKCLKMYKYRNPPNVFKKGIVLKCRYIEIPQMCSSTAMSQNVKIGNAKLVDVQKQSKL